MLPKKLLELIMASSEVREYKSKCKGLLGIPYHSVFCLLCLLSIYYLPLVSLLLELVSEVVSSAFRGTYDILLTKDDHTRSVGQYDNRGSFGELALMYNTPRAATIVATSEGALWALVSRERVPCTAPSEPLLPASGLGCGGTRRVQRSSESTPCAQPVPCRLHCSQ